MANRGMGLLRILVFVALPIRCHEYLERILLVQSDLRLLLTTQVEGDQDSRLKTYYWSWVTGDVDKNAEL